MITSMYKFSSLVFSSSQHSYLLWSFCEERLTRTRRSALGMKTLVLVITAAINSELQSLHSCTLNLKIFAVLCHEVPSKSVYVAGLDKNIK